MIAIFPIQPMSSQAKIDLGTERGINLLNLDSVRSSGWLPDLQLVAVPSSLISPYRANVNFILR